MIMYSFDSLAGSLGEPPRYRSMNDACATGADQLGPDFHGSRPMAGPAHPERPRMFEKQAVHDRVRTLASLLIVGHRSLAG
jgi:hypothetical protein